MKKLLWVLALVAGPAFGQVSTNYVQGQVLTASSLNFNFSLAAAVTNGTLTNPAITGGTATGLSLVGGVVPLASLAAQAANTIIGNGTGSTATPTAINVPSCSGASNALGWTSGTGLICNTSINAATLGGSAATLYALLASPTFTGTPAAPTAAAGTNTTQLATTAYVQTTVTGGANAASFTTIAASSTITPSQTAGIVGTTTNNNANAGSVGEYNTTTGTSTGLTTGTYTNLGSVSLTAGDWDVTAVVTFTVSAGATALIGGLGLTSGTNPGGFQTAGFVGITAGSGNLLLPLTRFSFSATTSVFCGGQANFSSGTVSAQCFIRARRIR